MEDVSLELEEPVNNPGTRVGTTLSVFKQNSFATFGQLWFLTTGRAELSK